MDNWSIILLIVGILLWGFIRILSTHLQRVKRVNFVRDYRDKFVKFSSLYYSGDKNNFDGESYVWLTKNVDKAQNYVGILGLMDYKPAFQNYIVPDYQLIINTLPKFRNGRIEEFDINAVDNCLQRYLGTSDDAINNNFKSLINPLVWFRVGIQELLSIPILLFNWTGLIRRSTVDNIKSSRLFRVLTGIVTLVSFVGGVISIIVGYDQTIQFIMSLWQDIM